jgi:transposase-like protein
MTGRLSWRVGRCCLGINVKEHGKTVAFLLRPDRGVAAAQAFFRKALSRCLPRWPRKITLDGLKQSPSALGSPIAVLSAAAVAVRERRSELARPVEYTDRTFNGNMQLVL